MKTDTDAARTNGTAPLGGDFHPSLKLKYGFQISLTRLVIVRWAAQVEAETTMSVAFTKEEATEAAASHLPDRPISPHPNFVTVEGLAKLEAALASAKEAVALAQTNVDLKTDRSAMSSALRDLRYFTARRASAQLSHPDGALGTVLFGRRVCFRREDGRSQTFRIVGEDEADPAQGSISYISPIAKSLLGKRVGEIVQLGESELEIISVD